MTNDCDRFRQESEVIRIDRPDGSIRFVNLDHNVVFLDSRSALVLVEILKSGLNRAAVQMSEAEAVPYDAVHTDLREFVEGLMRARILCRGGARKRFWYGLGDALASGYTLVLCKPLFACTQNLGARAWALLLIARSCVRAFGWGRTARVWQRRFDQMKFNVDTLCDEDLLRIDQTVQRLGRNAILKIECRERALACFALARHLGIRAELRIGLSYSPLAGHVWTQCGDRIISDDPANCRRYEPVIPRTG
jgi:hypothetical protein